MSLVNIVNMNILDNPTRFLNPLQFEITFECAADLEEDIEWKVVYVGSAENSAFDQVLDEITVGPVPQGVNKFILQTDAPDPSLIPESDIIGITVILVTCSYKEQEFARVGYYVNNEYRPFEGYNELDHGPPQSPLDLEKVYRTILADKPRVTRFQIQWSGDVEVSKKSISNENEGNVDMDMDCIYVGESGMSDDVSLLRSPEKAWDNTGSQQQQTQIVSPETVYKEFMNG